MVGKCLTTEGPPHRLREELCELYSMLEGQCSCQSGTLVTMACYVLCDHMVSRRSGYGLFYRGSKRSNGRSGGTMGEQIERQVAEVRGKPTRWHTLAPEELAGILQSDLARGLTADEVRNRLAVHGPNALPEPSPPSLLKLFLAQFTSLLIWVLIGAAVISGFLQEWVDAGAILTIVALNAALGFVQEFRAERSLAALRKLSVTTARVIREGVLSAVPACALVPGDLIQGLGNQALRELDPLTQVVFSQSLVFPAMPIPAFAGMAKPVRRSLDRHAHAGGHPWLSLPPPLLKNLHGSLIRSPHSGCAAIRSRAARRQVGQACPGSPRC